MRFHIAHRSPSETCDHGSVLCATEQDCDYRNVFSVEGSVVFASLCSDGAPPQTCIVSAAGMVQRHRSPKITGGMSAGG